MRREKKKLFATIKEIEELDIIASNLKYVRTHHGRNHKESFTQDEAARRIGISQSHVNKHEKPIPRPKEVRAKLP